MTNSKFTTDGYTKVQPLNEGYIRKGGTNPDASQIKTRPADPAPMRPASQPAVAQPTENTRALKLSSPGTYRRI